MFENIVQSVGELQQCTSNRPHPDLLEVARTLKIITEGEYSFQSDKHNSNTDSSAWSPKQDSYDLDTLRRLKVAFQHPTRMCGNAATIRFCTKITWMNWY
jgi:hypothetical protein